LATATAMKEMKKDMGSLKERTVLNRDLEDI
jgi:hypothetical protein